MLQVCFFCFAFHWIRVRTHLICQPDEKVWYYTWSVPPCPDEVLNGDNLDTTMWPHSDWAGVRPGHTSAQLFASEAGSQEASHSLNSWLVHPRAIVPAPWTAGWCPKPEAGLCQQAAESSAAPDHCSWVLGGNGGPWVTLRKGGQASHALCSFTTHLRNESSLKADCVLSVPWSPLVLLHRTDQQSALLPALPEVFEGQEGIQQSAKGIGIMQKHVAKHMETSKKLLG